MATYDELSNLKPCPFCGGEAVFHEHERVGVECIECGSGFACLYRDRDEAADEWNRLVGRTCQFLYDEKLGEYMCSDCGEQVSGSNPDDEYEVSAKAVLESFEYCPHCGARVIEEES